MSGAIAMAGMATLRSGAGLVRLAVPDVCLDVVATYDPCYMTTPLPSDREGRLAVTGVSAVSQLTDGATCIACGPGLGQSEGLKKFVRELYDTVSRPMVFDADALNAIASSNQPPPKPPASRILTPHPGEFRRLIADGDSDCPADELAERGIELARQWNVVLVLKGSRTLVTDGERVTRNTTGNPGMATGGSGDVLTGVITALVCQGLSAFDAAQLGVHVHGLAGDLAAQQLGEVAMTARDLVSCLPNAFQQIQASR